MLDSGDLFLRLTKQDLVQICGPADGIRMNLLLQQTTQSAKRRRSPVLMLTAWTQTESCCTEDMQDVKEKQPI